MGEQEEIQGVANIVVNRVIEQLGDSKLNASRLIKSLSDLTIQDVCEPDIGWENAKYHSTRLALELGNAKNDSDKDRRYINRIWKDMVEAFEVIEPSIENDARKAGYRKILKPRKTDPKTGRVEFYLDLQEVSEIETFSSDDEQGTPSGPYIEYECIKRPKPSLIGKLFTRIVINTPIWWAYHVVPILLAILAWGTFEYLSRTDDYHYWTEAVLFLFLCGWLFFLFLPFYSASDTGIAQAPIWMTKLITGDRAQLQFQESASKHKSGQNFYEITLVEYQGHCSVCKSDVKVGKGAGQYRGRLIGMCTRNPIEHIYSFDYVTRKGVPLRKDTYLG
jgi:hypothetical protein